MIDHEPVDPDHARRFVWEPEPEQMYGIVIRATLEDPPRWSLLQSFKTTDQAYAEAKAREIGQAVARVVKVEVAVVDPDCPHHAQH